MIFLTIFFSSAKLELYFQMIPRSSFITELEGDIYVSSASDSESPDNRKCILAVDSLKTLLGSFGDLYRFERATKYMPADESDESEVNFSSLLLIDSLLTSIIP